MAIWYAFASYGTPAAMVAKAPLGAQDVAPDPTSALAGSSAALGRAIAAQQAGDFAAARRETTSALEALALAADDAPTVKLLEAIAECARAVHDARTRHAALARLHDVRERTLPEEDAGRQRARLQLAAARFEMGDLKGARALEEQVVAVFSRTLPAAHPDLQGARRNLAGTLRSLGDLAGARALHEEVLAALSGALPEDDPALQAARLGLAGSLKALGDLEAARALEERVVNVFSRTLPRDHPDLLAARANLAITLHHSGELRHARDHMESVLAARERTLPEDHPGLQAARANLAATLFALGDLERARRLLEQSVAARGRTLPPDHPDLQGARANLAVVTQALGDLAAARAVLEQVLEVRVRTLAADHPDVLAARGNLAIALAQLGDLARARALEEQVLSARSRALPDDHPDLQAARLNLSATRLQLGDRAGARILQEQVLAVRERVLPEDHPALQAARLDLAVTLRSLGDPAGARALEERALAVYERTLPDDHPDVQRARSNLARSLEELSELGAARTLVDRVLAVRLRSLPEDHPDLQQSRQQLAFLLARAQARGGGASGATERAAFTAVAAQFAESLARTARSALRAGSIREAEERLDHAVAGADRALSFASGLGVFPADDGLQRLAFAATESTRGAALQAARSIRGLRSHPGHAPAREELAEARAAVARAGMDGAGAADLDRALERRDAAEGALLEILAATGSGDVPAADPAAVARSLAPGDAMIAFRRYARWSVDANGIRVGDEFCAFVIGAGGALRRVELGPATAIEEAVTAWIGSQGSAGVRGRRAEPANAAPMAPASGTAVRALVVDPLMSALGSARRLIVAPDDVLHLVPFDALPLDREVLGGRFEISVRTCLQDLRHDDTGVDAGLVLVALGNADFAAGAGDGSGSSASASLLRGGAWQKGFDPLPFTSAEARGVAALLEGVFKPDFAGRVVVLEADLASRGAIEEFAPQARFLHLATHGWFAPESVWSSAARETIDAQLGIVRQTTEDRIIGSSPMVLCGLALAGANLPPDEFGRTPGLITAEEIAGWDLSNCDLAVLSACDTNVGVRRAGQGVASLQKALHMAGARSVVTSLWKVPDEATKDLMLDFYRRLWVEKKPKHEALWEAKMRIRNAKDEMGQPRYTTRDWAAWVLTGDSE